MVWPYVGEPGNLALVSKRIVFLVTQNQRALLEFPSGKLNGPGVPHNNSCRTMLREHRVPEFAHLMAQSSLV
jgi:hypothetical protein